MARSQSRRRHCRHSSFDRLVRKAGYDGATDLAYTGTGDGVLSDLSVRPNCPDSEVWTITFTDATNFTVSGSTLGAQTAGVVGTLYESDAGEVAFLITAGGTPFVATDAFTFDTLVTEPQQSALVKSDRLRYAEDQTNRLGDVKKTAGGSVHAAYCADGTSDQTPGDRSNQFTSEDVNAAQSATDIGLGA